LHTYPVVIPVAKNIYYIITPMKKTCASTEGVLRLTKITWVCSGKRVGQALKLAVSLDLLELIQFSCPQTPPQCGREPRGDPTCLLDSAYCPPLPLLPRDAMLAR